MRGCARRWAEAKGAGHDSPGFEGGADSRGGVGILAAEVGQGFKNGGPEDFKAFADGGGFAGQVEDQATAAGTGGGAREDGSGDADEAVEAHNFAEAGQLAFQDSAGGFGGDVSGGDAGAAGGDDEIAGLAVGPFAELSCDAYGVVGNHRRQEGTGALEDFAEDPFDFGPALILVHAGAGAVAGGETADADRA